MYGEKQTVFATLEWKATTYVPFICLDKCTIVHSNVCVCVSHTYFAVEVRKFKITFERNSKFYCFFFEAKV